MYICIYVYMYVYMYLCITHPHTHANTHTNTHRQNRELASSTLAYEETCLGAYWRTVVHHTQHNINNR